jgi:hypothetical protein
MTSLALPVMVSGLILASVAWIWHAVTEHHVHLILARKVNPDICVPQTRHDARWHGMNHRRRMGVNATLIGAAFLLAVSWQAERTATAVTVLVIAVAGCAWMAARSISHAIGERRHLPDPDLEDD